MRSCRIKLAVLALTLLCAGATWADPSVVLVAYKDSPIESISLLEVRKVYLGIRVFVDGRSVTAYRRRDDEHLNDIFMQVVAAMSRRSYERRLLSLTLKYGSPRPTEVDGLDALVEELSTHPMAIGYTWQSDAEKDERLKVLRVLWKEP